MRNSTIACIHFNNTEGLVVEKLYPPEDSDKTIRIHIHGAGSVLATPQSAAALASQLNEYLARFARENDLTQARDVGGFK